ncbi:Splicing factor-like protein [Trema orientale]|uniref:Splicing factor-like protein n=1 Tax=Trema orientale TaxID=63057 RepID=A0A2P5EFQ6_TREOI|nr:Splicing factor-like protein [Trema orientale]
MAQEVRNDDIIPEKEHDNATNIASSSTSFINKTNGNTQRNKIFVGGWLPHDLQEHEFRSHFESFGSITDIVIMRDKQTLSSSSLKKPWTICIEEQISQTN